MRNLDYMELFCPIHSISCPKWISILLHYMLLLFLFLTFIQVSQVALFRFLLWT